jgi:cytochrome bd-type quinol oxidase subunit 1
MQTAVGLASFIAVLEGLHLATGREVYFRISTFCGRSDILVWIEAS